MVSERLFERMTEYYTKALSKEGIGLTKHMKVFYLGIDFGATFIRAITCDKSGENMSAIIKNPLIRKETVDEELEVNMIRLINRACMKKEVQGGKLGGIGIALAASFHPESGIISHWPNNNKYRAFPLKSFLKERYGVPVVLEDDANAAALGEQLAGKGRGLKNFVYVTISTGIGCGIISNNRLITGDHGWAGELGHIKVTEENILCDCGQKGCLQAVASGPAILQDFIKSVKNKNYLMDTKPSLKDVVYMAHQGDKNAVNAFKKAGGYIGQTLAGLAVLLDISVIILGGGVIVAGDLLTDPIIEVVNNILGSQRNIKILISELNDKNGMLGALYLINKLNMAENED